jgi:release factor glutamine methyltransferase
VIEVAIRSAMSIRALLDWGTRVFEEEKMDTPRLDAEVILAHVLEKNRTYLFTWPETRVPDEAVQRFYADVQRRVRREPVAYIVERKDFFSLILRVTPDVLIPRAETEVLVTTSVQWLQDRDAGSRRVLDLGTGSGAVAIALARNVADCTVVATDVSPSALAIAEENGARHGVERLVEWRQGDLWEAVGAEERFNLIVSNPPYVSEEEYAGLQPNVRDYEPRMALVAADEGLAVLRAIADGAARHLEPGGALGMEIGSTQGAAANRLLTERGFEGVRVLSDLSGLDRIVWGSVPGEPPTAAGNLRMRVVSDLPRPRPLRP